MNQMKIVLLMVGLFSWGSISQSLAAESNPIQQAFSKRQQYSIPASGGYQCGILHDASNLVLDAVEARNLEFKCHYYQPAWLSFNSLNEKISHPEEPSVPAVWVMRRISLFRDGYSCADLANWMDWLLDKVAVRNIQSYVFCDANGGSLQYQFEALVPASAVTEPEFFTPH